MTEIDKIFERFLLTHYVTFSLYANKNFWRIFKIYFFTNMILLFFLFLHVRGTRLNIEVYWWNFLWIQTVPVHNFCALFKTNSFHLDVHAVYNIKTHSYMPFFFFCKDVFKFGSGTVMSINRSASVLDSSNTFDIIPFKPMVFCWLFLCLEITAYYT